MCALHVKYDHEFFVLQQILLFTCSIVVAVVVSLVSVSCMTT